MENSEFVSDPEITKYLNQSLAELWSRLTQGSGQPFYRAQNAIAVVAGTALYALPADFGSLQGVEATINGFTGALTPFMPIERARLSNVQSPWGTISPVQYRLQADNIEFLPATQTFPATLFYSPSCPRLVALTDTFDGFQGFEDAAIYAASATVLAKEGSDPNFYLGERDRIYRHIDSMASQRDMSMPERVQDVIGETVSDVSFGSWP